MKAFWTFWALFCLVVGILNIGLGGGNQHVQLIGGLDLICVPLCFLFRHIEED